MSILSFYVYLLCAQKTGLCAFSAGTWTRFAFCRVTPRKSAVFGLWRRIIRPIGLYLYALYRNVTIWPLVQGSSGAKLVADLPAVMSFANAHATAFA